MGQGPPPLVDTAQPAAGQGEYRQRFMQVDDFHHHRHAVGGDDEAIDKDGEALLGGGNKGADEGCNLKSADLGQRVYAGDAGSIEAVQSQRVSNDARLMAHTLAIEARSGADELIRRPAEKSGRANDLKRELDDLYEAENKATAPGKTSIPAAYLRVTVQVQVEET